MILSIELERKILVAADADCLVDDCADAVLALGEGEAVSEAPLPVSRGLLRHREENDGYVGEVVRITDRVRVINCKDDIQWIVQRRKGEQWQSVSFCRTRDGLIRFARHQITPTGEWPYREAPPDALAVLQALPERHA
jgi:hypothetical protein